MQRRHGVQDAGDAFSLSLTRQGQDHQARQRHMLADYEFSKVVVFGDQDPILSIRGLNDRHIGGAGRRFGNVDDVVARRA